MENTENLRASLFSVCWNTAVFMTIVLQHTHQICLSQVASQMDIEISLFQKEQGRSMMPDHRFHSWVPVLKVLPAPCMLNHSSNPHNCCLALPGIQPPGDREYYWGSAPAKAEVNWSWGVAQKLCFCFYALWISAVTLSLNPINMMFGKGTERDNTQERGQGLGCLVKSRLTLVKLCLKTETI